MITLNDILWMSISKQLDWSNSQDWTGTTKEERQKMEDAKGVEIFKELKAKYGLR